MGKSGTDGRGKDRRKDKDQSTPPLAEVAAEITAVTEVSNKVVEEAPGTYTCSICGTKATPDAGITNDGDKPDYRGAKLWARHKLNGSKNPTVVFCLTCKVAEENAAIAAGQEKPGFSPLMSSLERDARYDAKGSKAEQVQRQLLERQYEPDMREVRKDMVCVRCHKHHGQIMHFHSGGFRITIIEHALPLNMEQDVVQAEPICRDCVSVLNTKAGEKGQEFERYYLGNTQRKAAGIMEKRNQDAAFLDRGHKRSRVTLRESFPAELRKTGTNSR